MLTIITSIIGFLGGFVPDVLKYFKQKQDNAHELAIMDKQIEAQKILHEQRIEEINVQADVAESQALYKVSEIKQTGVKWADAFLALYNGSVRPSITYLFTGLYVFVKVAQVKSLMVGSGVSLLDAVKYTYTELDMSCLTLVLSYWFGARAAAKVFGWNKK